MKQSRLEIITGAIVLLVALFSIIYLIWFQPLTVMSGGYTIKAQFARVDGITEGSYVYMSGVKIGKVTKVTLNPQNYQVVLNLSISQSISIPEDSSADIISESLIGGKKLSITPGGSNKTLSNGGMISYTQSPLNLESLLIKAFVNGPSNKDNK